MALGVTNYICIWSHNLFLFLTKLQSPSHTRNAFAKKTNKISQCLCSCCLGFFLCMSLHTNCFGVDVFWRSVEKQGKNCLQGSPWILPAWLPTLICVLTSELDEVALAFIQLCFEKPEEWRFHRNLIPQSFCETISSLGQHTYNFCVNYVLELFLNNVRGVMTCTWRWG